MVPLIHIVFAIGLPAFALWKRGKQSPLKRPYLFSIASFIFCSMGIIAEIQTIKRRLFAGDIGGIEDTIDAVLLICGIFLIITVLINLLLLALSFERNHNTDDKSEC